MDLPTNSSKLFADIGERYDSVVLVGVYTTTIDGKDAEAYECFYQGTKTTAMGLVERAKISLTEEIYVDMYGPPGGGEGEEEEEGE